MYIQLQLGYEINQAVKLKLITHIYTSLEARVYLKV